MIRTSIRIGAALLLIGTIFFVSRSFTQKDDTPCADSPYGGYSFVNVPAENISPLNNVSLSWNLAGHTRSEPVDVDVIQFGDHSPDKVIYKIASKLKNTCTYQWTIQSELGNYLSEGQSYYVRVTLHKIAESAELGEDDGSTVYSRRHPFYFTKALLPSMEKIEPSFANSGDTVIVTGSNFSAATRIFVVSAGVVGIKEVLKTLISSKKMTFVVPADLPATTNLGSGDEYWVGITDMSGSITSVSEIKNFTGFSLGVNWTQPPK